MTAKRRPGLRLEAPRGDLPLAFSQYEMFREGGYLADGASVSKRAIGARLRALGVGVKTVTFRGEYVSEGAGDLKPWERTVTVPGTLDPDGLARLGHEVARRVVEVRRGRTRESPPEMYTTAIDVKPGMVPPKRRRPRIIVAAERRVQMPSGTRRTIYQGPDGRFISRATYTKLRANAKRRAARKTAAKRKK